MSLTLKFPTRCSTCGGKMDAGEEYIPSSNSEGAWLRSHLECPEKKQRVQNAPQSFDVETTLHVRKCSSCGELWTFPKTTVPEATCPSNGRMVKGERVRCDGAWLRGDPEEIGWAA